MIAFNYRDVIAHQKKKKNCIIYMKPYCTHVGVLEFYWVVSLSCISYYFVGKGLMNDDLRFLDNGEL